MDARKVSVVVRARRLVCPTLGCHRQTFREQLPGVLARYQRRTPRLAVQVGAVVRELAGRAGTRVLSALATRISKNTALRRGRRYATVLTDAVTNTRIDVLPHRTADTLEAWLRDHPGVEIVVRDGFAAYAEAVRRARPVALQVADSTCP